MGPWTAFALGLFGGLILSWFWRNFMVGFKASLAKKVADDQERALDRERFAARTGRLASPDSDDSDERARRG